MAKKYKNNKGFLIIEMSYKEAKDICGFGISEVDQTSGVELSHSLFCDTCNNVVENTIYYVAAINRALCKECCDDFINNVNRYKEDIPYEVKHYNHYAIMLGMTDLASVQDDKPA